MPEMRVVRQGGHKETSNHSSHPSCHLLSGPRTTSEMVEDTKDKPSTRSVTTVIKGSPAVPVSPASDSWGHGILGPHSPKTRCWGLHLCSWLTLLGAAGTGSLPPQGMHIHLPLVPARSPCLRPDRCLAPCRALWAGFQNRDLQDPRGPGVLGHGGQVLCALPHPEKPWKTEPHSSYQSMAFVSPGPKGLACMPEQSPRSKLNVVLIEVAAGA